MKVSVGMLFLLIISSLIFSQGNIILSGDYINTTLNARSISLGESFVANPTGISSVDNNPATIIGNSNLDVSYTRRDDGWLNNSKAVFYSLGTTIKTPIGFWALMYKRYNSGILITTTENPEGNGDYVNDYTMSLSYANNLSDDFAVGLTLKNFTDDYGSNYKFNKPVLLDFGLLFSSKGFIQTEMINDNIFVGAAIQNFGGRLKLNYETVSFDQYCYSYNLSRYVKLGFTYEMDVKKIKPLVFID